MKDKPGVALKNQFVFDVVTSPLNSMVRAPVSKIKFTRLQRSLHNFWIKLQIVTHYYGSVTRQDVVIDLFALGIVNFGKLRSIANTLQERRFTSIRSADHEDSEVTYAIEVLFDFRGVQLDLCMRTFSDHVIGIRGGIELDLSSRKIFCDHVTSITRGGIEFNLFRRTLCDRVISIRTLFTVEPRVS